MNSSNESYVLKVENLTKSFGNKTILNSLSFSIKKGEVVGFLGSNGAGKSTTLRCILGIYAYEKGLIKFNFSNKNTNDYLNLIGYLPEERGLYKNVKVMDMLLYFSRLKNYPDSKAKKRALYYLKKFDLEGKEKVKIDELSKGMAQKVQFIGSILHEPELLILDEPLSGLDPVSQDLFKKELLELSKKGTTVFFSSHQIELVEELCKRVYLLNKGNFVLSGDISTIKKNYGGQICYLRGSISKKFIENFSLNILLENTKEHKFYLKNNININDFMLNLSKEKSIEEVSIKRISLHDIYVKEVKKLNPHEEEY